MSRLAASVGEASLFSRTGGAPSLAVGMAKIFSGVLGGKVAALWYHFAIMFEALFILTTLDAGTRAARFMLQDLLGNIWKPLADSASWTSIVITSAMIVAAWGYFLYFGTIDPLGGINSLWPLFGIANQMLAAIALCVATSMIIRRGKARYVWVTLTPLAWLVAVTMTAGYQKIFSTAANIGFLTDAAQLAAERAGSAITGVRAAQIERLIWNDRVDALMTAVFIVTVLIVLMDSIRVWAHLLIGSRQARATAQEAA
jgi:carbon starvation protein